MKKTSEIGIRDPFVLLFDGKYYLYGTRNYSTWGPADGFDAYVSENLEDWDGPFEIFHRPDGFWATENYWAPEVICRDNKFILVTTFGSADRKKGIMFLTSDSPLGPFVPTTEDRVTPHGWTCIDGTVYTQGDESWLIFSHGFPEDLKGAMVAMKINDDFTGLIGEPKVLFHASGAPWSKPLPFAKEEFGIDGDVFFVDGPFVTGEEDGALCMIFSSWSEGGYAVGRVRSGNGGILGPWEHMEDVLAEDGGHGMVFTTKEGKRLLAIHAPNDTPNERPVFLEL